MHGCGILGNLRATSHHRLTHFPSRVPSDPLGIRCSHCAGGTVSTAPRSRPNRSPRDTDKNEVTDPHRNRPPALQDSLPVPTRHLPESDPFVNAERTREHHHKQPPLSHPAQSLNHSVTSPLRLSVSPSLRLSVTQSKSGNPTKPWVYGSGIRSMLVRTAKRADVV